MSEKKERQKRQATAKAIKLHAKAIKLQKEELEKQGFKA